MSENKPSAVELYLLDLVGLIKEKALESKSESDAAGADDKQYALGRLMAFHEVVSLLRDQAEAFGIDLATLSLADIEPERDLL